MSADAECRPQDRLDLSTVGTISPTLAGYDPTFTPQCATRHLQTLVEVRLTQAMVRVSPDSCSDGHSRPFEVSITKDVFRPALLGFLDWLWRAADKMSPTTRCNSETL